MAMDELDQTEPNNRRSDRSLKESPKAERFVDHRSYSVEQSRKGTAVKMRFKATSTWKHVDFGIVALIAIFAVLSLPLLFTFKNGVYSVDEHKWHVPAIKLIYEHWPAIDVRNDSLSAVAPGYHYVLATIAHVTGLGLINLRLVNWTFSLLLIPLLYWHVGRYCSKVARFLIIAPCVTSSFFVKSAAWILTDNASLMFVLLSLIAIIFSRASAATAGVVAISSAAATFFRQISLWLAGPAFMSGLMHIVESRMPPAGTCTVERRGGWLMIAACVAPVAVMAWLFYEWKGLVPPGWRAAAYGGWSLCPIAYLLSLTAVLGAPYCIFLRVNPLRDLPRVPLILGIMMGFILSILSPASYERAQAGGYLWDIVLRTPKIFDRSILFVALAPVGLLVVIALAYRAWLQLGYKVAILWSTSWLAWSATFVVNRQMFQRYMEPTILVLLVLLAAPLYIHAAKPGRARFIQWTSLGLLTLFQVAVTMTAWYRTLL
jgi:hypothetical protein